jgi:nitrogen-specific signal transduction histidine kinase
MDTMGLSGKRLMGTSSGDQRKGCRMTLSQLRHDIRNHLNAIKLSCALLQRRQHDPAGDDSLREIDHSADSINELVTQFLGDADAPAFFLTERERDSAEA